MQFHFGTIVGALFGLSGASFWVFLKWCIDAFIHMYVCVCMAALLLFEHVSLRLLESMDASEQMHQTVLHLLCFAASQALV